MYFSTALSSAGMALTITIPVLALRATLRPSPDPMMVLRMASSSPQKSVTESVEISLPEVPPPEPEELEDELLPSAESELVAPLT